MSDSEWEGEPHTLIVRSVEPPAGPFDNAHLDYEIQHPPACRQEERGNGANTYMAWTCELSFYETEADLAFCLSYSGTPITEPGSYQVRSWGRKSYIWDYAAYEHDGGVAVMTEAAA